MNAKLSKTLKYTLSIAAAILLLWFSFRGVEWSEFTAVLKKCKWFYVGLSMVMGTLGFLIRSLRWRLLLLPVDEKTRRTSCFSGVNIGNLANFVLPHAGEFVRCGYITGNSEKVDSRHRKASYDQVLGTVVLERAWDIIMLLLMICVLLAFKWSDFGNFFMDKVVSPLTGKSEWGFWILVAAVVSICIASVWAVIKLRDKSRLCEKITGFFLGIWNGVVTFTRMKNKVLFLVYTVMLWATFLSMTLATIQAVPDSSTLGLSDGIFLMLVGAIAGIVPVPGGFGAFHYMIALSLQTVYGISWDTGIVFATLSHETQAITMVILGLCSYAYESLKKENIYKKNI